MFVKNFSGVPPRWLPGKVLRVTGPLSYEVEPLDGRIVCRHVESCTMEENSSDASEHTDEVEELGEDSGISYHLTLHLLKNLLLYLHGNTPIPLRH